MSRRRLYMELYGNIRDYFAAFGFGVLTSFTPCVYPLIPITAGIHSGDGFPGHETHGFFSFHCSMFWVWPLRIPRSQWLRPLSGKIFGMVQSHPLTHIIVAHILIFFSLVLFDIIPLPVFSFTIHHKIKVRNAWVIILFGMAAGLAVGPCTGPVLGTLLLYVASKQNIWHGVSLTFVFSCGLGASLILVGTFSGILSNLPRSGKWLVRVKHLCGIILILAAEYFILKAGGVIPWNYR